MNDVELRAAKKVGQWKVSWEDRLIGLVRDDSAAGEGWRMTYDLKGEFWDLNTFSSQDEAVEALVELKKKMDEDRLNFLNQ